MVTFCTRRETTLRRLVVLGAAWSAVAIWGGTPLATKIAVLELEPLAVGALRTVLAAAIALPLALICRLSPPIGHRERGFFIVSSVAGSILFPLVFALGIEGTSAGHGALVLAITPIFTGLVAAALDRRSPSPRWWLGCAVAFCGVTALTAGRFGLGWSHAGLIGDLMVAASALTAAAGYVAGARAAARAGTWAVTLWGQVLGGAVCLPLLAYLQPWSDLDRVGASAWTALVYLAALSSVAAYAAWYWALARGGVARTGAHQFVQPLIGLALAIVLLGESLTWPLALAAGTIMVGVAIAQGEQGGPRPKPRTSTVRVSLQGKGRRYPNASDVPGQR